MSESAVAAAAAVAAEHGLRSDDPTVLRDAWHVLVHLRPLPLVARVSSGRPYPEGPPEEDVIRELAVGSHAARAGAPVVPPSDLLDPGPHRHGRHVVAFWKYAGRPREVEPEAAGEALRAIHEALADYEGELPSLHTDDLVGIVDGLEPSADAELLRELGTRQPAGPTQAIHGDAHLANCMPGPLWHDFETACSGPREFDLAALVLSGRTRDDEPSRIALAAYGEHDADLLEECIPIYSAWIYASFMSRCPVARSSGRCWRSGSLGFARTTPASPTVSRSVGSAVRVRLWLCRASPSPRITAERSTTPSVSRWR